MFFILGVREIATMLWVPDKYLKGLIIVILAVIQLSSA